MKLFSDKGFKLAEKARRAVRRGEFHKAVKLYHKANWFVRMDKKRLRKLLKERMDEC